MYLLTDGTEKNPLLGFCLSIISQHSEKWPPTEEILARAFVHWLRSPFLLTQSRMKELCQANGVDLSFVPLPEGMRGFNWSWQGGKGILITSKELAPFADVHTLFHEFRELLEHEFEALRYPTHNAKGLPEVQAELFATFCRMEAGMKEMPAFFEMAQNVEKRWARYFTYALVLLFGAAHLFSCIYLPQMEEALSEARQRYIGT